jgi:hypothetical protein
LLLQIISINREPDVIDMIENTISHNAVNMMENPINRGQLFHRSMIAVILFMMGTIFSLIWSDYDMIFLGILLFIIFLMCAIYAEIINPPNWVIIKQEGVLFQRRFIFKERFYPWNELGFIQLYSDSERYQGLHVKMATIWIGDTTKTIFVSYEIALVIIDECLKITGRQIRSIKMN